MILALVLFFLASLAQSAGALPLKELPQSVFALIQVRLDHL